MTTLVLSFVLLIALVRLSRRQPVKLALGGTAGVVVLAVVVRVIGRLGESAQGGDPPW